MKITKSKLKQIIKEEIDIDVGRHRHSKFVKYIDDVSQAIQELDPADLDPSNILLLVRKMEAYFENLRNKLLDDEPNYDPTMATDVYGRRSPRGWGSMRPTLKFQKVTMSAGALKHFRMEVPYTIKDYDRYNPCFCKECKGQTEKLTLDLFKRGALCYEAGGFSPEAQARRAAQNRIMVGKKVKTKFRHMWHEVIHELEGAMNVLDESKNMKSSKTQLKQIIMEELNETHYALGPLSVDVPDQYVMEKLAQVVDPIADAYNDLATPEEQETFEENLVKEIDEYVQQWRQQRGEEM
tara:strand:- start:753 stop:1637 length:885 start_codon:yes stop_codon:yes gene_type:complete